MSDVDVEIKMTLELLPNEILLLCFEYLNAQDIFFAFDCLNSRFAKIIRNIPLCLDLEFFRRVMLDDFYEKMIANPQIKDQVIMIRLSQRVSYGATRALLSRFSLKEFTNLQSLKFIYLGGGDVKTILPMLPFLSNLRCFDWSHWTDGYDRSDWKDDLHWSEWKKNLDQQLTSSPASTIQTSSDVVRLTDKYLSMTKVTILQCSVEEMCELFEYAPRLSNLTIKSVSESRSEGQIIKKRRRSIETAVNMKYLNMSISTYFGADSLQVLFKYTPYLRSLVVQVQSDEKMELMDAGLWQHLITSALPILNVFKFKLSTQLYRCEKNIVAKFQEFQSDFWHQQHHWYTECIIDSNWAHIYTIPYLSNEFELTLSTKRYCHASSNKAKTFDKVTDLILSPDIIDESCEFHFSNVKSLILRKSFEEQNYVSIQFGSTQTYRLKTVVNFENLNHLDINPCCFMKLSSIVSLLKKMPRLSSLRIDKDNLFVLINSDELCSYLKRIQKLDIDVQSSSLISNEDIMHVCEIFSNMKEFRCCLTDPLVFSTTLRELSNLTKMTFFMFRTSDKTHPYFFSNKWKSEINQASFVVAHAICMGCDSFNY